MISAYEYIIQKQLHWAKNRGLDLIGSKGEHGRPLYAQDLKSNLYAPLMASSENQFKMANGNEIVSSIESPAKMQALHSSSALGVNVFQYWASINQVPVIASACGFCRPEEDFSKKIIFEEKYHIKGINRIPPNIDVVIHNSNSSKYKRFAIESKFSEPYRHPSNKGLKSAYLDVDALWVDLPEIHKLAKAISPIDTVNKYFDSAQLIKHILGLKSHFPIDEFKLLYIWYDVLGIEGVIHRNEIEEFAKIAKADGVEFLSLSYQELIITLANQYRHTHSEYVDYITNRYL